jgi:hypothetical protein
MTSEILENGDLKLSIDAEDQELLRVLQAEDPDGFCSDNTMYDWFEAFIGNDEYEWIRPEECGALTSAPMLGIYSSEREKQNTDGTDIAVTGHWDNITWVQDVLKCWAFMDYQIVSPQERLMETGSAILTSGGQA